MQSDIIEAEIIQPNKTFFSRLSRAQWVDIAIVSPILIFLLLAGVCRAYDSAMQSYLEDSLNKNVTAIQASGSACEASYQALVKYKTDSNMKLTGAGDPCTTFMSPLAPPRQ